jgi:NADPH:quinone reductase-like Zn-dependent oxidoreductase
MKEIPVPTIKDNQVLVKVKSVSINPLDWKIRKGEMKMMSGSKFPKQIGVDFAGIIENTGASVTKFKIGDEVFGAVNGMKEGALAEYIAIDVNSIWSKPKQISFEQASSIPTVGAAAFKAIEELANVSTDTTILINGCTGGVGMMAIQLAKQKGAKVTGVCGTNGIDFAKKWGCNTVIDYSKTDVLHLSEEFDVILELSGKLKYNDAKKIMKPKSVFINPIPQFTDILKSPFVNIGKSKKNKILLGSPTTNNMNYLTNAIENGLHIEVSNAFKFDNFKDAYKLAEKGGFIGKIAIEI